MRSDQHGTAGVGDERPFDAVLAMPFGAVGIRVGTDAIEEIAYLPPGTPAREPANALARRACEQISRYAEDPEVPFDLPLDPSGTDFQRRVWRAIAAIPRGETRTYGELASSLRSSPRAVGQACGANPLPIVVPCHRVVASGGLGGFAHHESGYLIDTKRWLLAHEGWSGARRP